MRLREFKLERYFAEHEFSARYLLSSSDCEPLSVKELLSLADPRDRELWDELVLAYTESPGHPELRARIARMHPAIGADDVLCAAPEEGIFLAMNALLEPGDRVVVLHPAYQSLHEVARGIGCTVEHWPLLLERGAWRLDLGALEKALRRGAELVVVNFPHNPTGFQPSLQELTAVLEMAAAAGAWVFSDEMYRGLEIGESPALPTAAALSSRAVSLSGLSKTYGLPGLRMGWLICQDHDLLRRAQSLKDFTTICAAAPAEILALIAVEKHEELAARNRAIVRRNLGLAAELFASTRARGWRLLPPLAGSVCLAALGADASAEKFCEVAVREHGLMIVPSTAFDMDDHMIRLGLGRESFPAALSVLSEILSV